MSSTLTPDQQNQVTRAGQFLAARDEGRAALAAHLGPEAACSFDLDAYAAGAAAEHIQRLLTIIGDLTGDAS